MKKAITYLAAIAALFAALWWFGARPHAASVLPAKASGLSAAETYYDFGTISMAKGKVTKAFAFVNSSGKDVTISNVATSCMCTAAYFAKPDGSKLGPFGMPGMGPQRSIRELVPAGESRIVEVVFDPAAHGPAGVGPISRFVVVKDSEGGELKFEFKAVVMP